MNDPLSIGAALKNVGTVVACVAQREPHLLRLSIARGLAYTAFGILLVSVAGYMISSRPSVLALGAAFGTLVGSADF